MNFNISFVSEDICWQTKTQGLFTNCRSNWCSVSPRSPVCSKLSSFSRAVGHFSLTRQTTLKWIPAHCGITGNEKADNTWNYRWILITKHHLREVGQCNNEEQKKVTSFIDVAVVTVKTCENATTGTLYSVVLYTPLLLKAHFIFFKSRLSREPQISDKVKVLKKYQQNVFIETCPHSVLGCIMSCDLKCRANRMYALYAVMVL